MLTLMAFFFNGSRFEIQNPSRVLWFLGGQLLPDFFHIFGMDVVVNAAAEPIVLGLVQNGSDGIRDVNDSAGVAGHDKQKSVGRFQYQMLELLIRQKGRFVSPVGGRVSGTWKNPNLGFK